MKMTLHTDHAADLLRADQNANWSHRGARALIEYMEELEEDTGEEIEFDAVAIRCDFSEYESLQTWAHEYFSNAWEELGFDESEEIESDEFDEKIREHIQENGTLIEFEGGVIVSSF